MSFLLHKVTFIHASLAAVFQLQRSKAGTDLSAQSQNTLCASIIVVKTVYIPDDGNLTCKRNLYMQDLDQYMCCLTIIYSFSKRVRSSAIRHLGTSRAVYLGVELVALIFF